MSGGRRVTFVRHAMPRVDAHEPTDTWDLTEDGIAAARALRISGADAPAVVSSPEHKARRTTALVMRRPLHDVPTDRAFREIDRVELVHEDFRAARRAWVAGAADERHRGWEAPDAAVRRVSDGLRAQDAQHVVVGTHGMVLTAWLVGIRLISPGEEAVSFWESLRFPDVVDVTLDHRGLPSWHRR